MPVARQRLAQSHPRLWQHRRCPKDQAGEFTSSLTQIDHRPACCCRKSIDVESPWHYEPKELHNHLSWALKKINAFPKEIDGCKKLRASAAKAQGKKQHTKKSNVFNAAA